MPVGLAHLPSTPAFSGTVTARGGQRSPHPSPRSATVCGFISGRLYTATGYTGVYSALTHEWDPVTDAWTRKASAPTARSAAAGGVLRGLLHVVGGMSSVYHAQNEAFDPVANAWTTKAPMPNAIRNQAAAVLGDRLYLIGGYDGTTDRDTVYVHEPVSNTWDTRAPAPWVGEAGRAVAFEGLIYYIGGVHGSRLSNCAAFDPNINAWTAKAPMPTPRSHFGIAVIDERIHCVGGRDATGAATNVHEAYEPRANQWIPRAPVPVAVESQGYAEYEGVFYQISGFSAGARIANLQAYVGYIWALRLGQGRPVRVLRIGTVAETPSVLKNREKRVVAGPGGLLPGAYRDVLVGVPEADGDYGWRDQTLTLDLVWE